MAKRELSKCRIWERERRDRLKNSFNALGKLLPCYDPSSTLSKIEILQKAATHITELQNKVKELLSGASEGPQNQRAEIQKLEDRIQKLLIRNEQLTNLLQTAGIKVPTAIGTIQNFTQNKKFSHKITPEIAENLCKKLTKNGPHKKGSAKSKNDPKVVKNGPKIQKKKKKTVAPNENVDLNNKQKLQKKKKSSKTNSTLASPEKQILAPQGPTLGPGALIFADGRILPIARPLQAPPTPLIPPIIAQNGIQRPQLVGSTLTTPNGLVATTFTTPSLTRPLLATPIVATPTQPRPTTVILMRQRPVACKTKVPIPPLRKKILESPILGKNDSKIGGKCLKRRKIVAKKKLIAKDVNKYSKNFLDPKNLSSDTVGPSTIAKLQETVKKIDIDSSIDCVKNGPSKEELGSKNPENGPKSDRNDPNPTQPQNIQPVQIESTEKSKKSKIDILKIVNLPQNGSERPESENENFGPVGPKSENFGPVGPKSENFGPGASLSENSENLGPQSENGPKVTKSENLGPIGPQNGSSENVGVKEPKSQNLGSSGSQRENFGPGGPKSENGPNVSKSENLGRSGSHSENSENLGLRSSKSENLGLHDSQSEILDSLGPKSENVGSNSQSKNDCKGPKSENFGPKGPKDPQNGPSDPQSGNFGSKSENFGPNIPKSTNVGPAGPQSENFGSKSEVPKSSENSFPNEDLTQNLPKVPKSPLSQNDAQNLVVPSEKLDKGLPNLNLVPKTDGNSIKITPVKSGNENSTCILENFSKPGVPIEKNPKIEFQFLENKELVVETSFGDSPTKNLAVTEVATHSELSNDIFATFSSGNQHTSGHPESLSPTAAFLLAFPLVSTLTGSSNAKNNEVSGNEETCDSRQDTPTLLQIGTIESTPKSASENLLNLDSFTFFGQSFDEKRHKADRGQLDFIWSNFPKKLELPKAQFTAYNPFSDQEKGFQSCGYDSFHLESCSKDVQGKNMEISGSLEKSNILHLETGPQSTQIKTGEEKSISLHLELSSKDLQSKNIENPTNNVQLKAGDVPKKSKGLHLEPSSKDIQIKTLALPQKTPNLQLETLKAQGENSKVPSSHLEIGKSSGQGPIQKVDKQNISKIEEKVVQTSSALSKKVENISENPGKSTSLPGKTPSSNQKAEEKLGSEKSVQNSPEKSYKSQSGEISKNLPKTPFHEKKSRSGDPIGNISKLEGKSQIEQAIRTNPPKTQPGESVGTNFSKIEKSQSGDSIGTNLSKLEHLEIDKDKKVSNRPPVNWMTTPDTRHQIGENLPPLELGSIFGSHNWDFKNNEEDNRWSWSPGKLLPPLIGSQDHVFPVGTSELPPLPSLSDITPNFVPSLDFQSKAVESRAEQNNPKSQSNKMFFDNFQLSNVPKSTSSGTLDVPVSSRSMSSKAEASKTISTFECSNIPRSIESKMYQDFQSPYLDHQTGSFKYPASSSAGENSKLATSNYQSTLKTNENSVTSKVPNEQSKRPCYMEEGSKTTGQNQQRKNAKADSGKKLEPTVESATKFAPFSLELPRSGDKDTSTKTTEIFHLEPNISDMQPYHAPLIGKGMVQSTSTSQPSKIENQFYQVPSIGIIPTSSVFGSSKSVGQISTSKSQPSKGLEPQYYQATSIGNVPTSNIFGTSKTVGKTSTSDSQPFYQSTSVGKVPTSNIFGTTQTEGKISTGNSQSKPLEPQIYQATSIGNVSTSNNFGSSKTEGKYISSHSQPFYQVTSTGNVPNSNIFGTSVTTCKISTSNYQPSKPLEPQFYQATSIGNTTSKGVGADISSKIHVLPPLYQSTADIFGNSDQQNASKVQVPKMENQFYQPSSIGGETPKSLENQFYQSSIGLSGPPTSFAGPTFKGVDQGPRQNSSCSKVDIKCTYTISNSAVGSKIQSSTYSIGSVSASKNNDPRNMLFGQNEQVNISMSHMTVPVALPTGKLKEHSSLPLGHVDHGSFLKSSNNTPNLFQTQEMGPQVQKTFQNQNIPKANYGPKLENLPSKNYAQKAPNFIQKEPNMFSQLDNNFVPKLENTAHKNYPISSTQSGYSQSGNLTQKVYNQNLDQMTHFLPNKSSSSFPQKDPVANTSNFAPKVNTPKGYHVEQSTFDPNKPYQPYEVKTSISGPKMYPSMDPAYDSNKTANFGSASKGTDNPGQKMYQSFQTNQNTAPKTFPPMEHGSNSATKVYTSIEHGSNSAPKSYPQMEHGSNAPKPYTSMEHGSNPTPKTYPSMEHSNNAPKVYPLMENSSNSAPKGYQPMEHNSNAPKAYNSMEHGSNLAPKVYTSMEHGSNAPKVYPSMEHGSNPAPKTYAPMEHGPFVPKVESTTPKGYPLDQMSFNQNKTTFLPKEELFSNPPSVSKSYHPLEHCPSNFQISGTVPKESAPKYQSEPPNFDQHPKGTYNQNQKVEKPYQMWEGQIQTFPENSASVAVSKGYSIGYQDFPSSKNMEYSYGKFPIFTNSDMNAQTSSNPFGTPSNSGGNLPFRHSESGQNLPISTLAPSLEHGKFPLEHGNLYPIGNIGTSTSLTIGDHSLGVPTTLPTLVGELGLGSGTNLESEGSRRASKRKNVQNIGQNYDLQSSNTFSVSHLVEPNGKDEVRTQGAKRNTSGKSVSDRQTKRKADCFRNQSQKWPESKRQKNSTSNSTNYSAEALISDSKYQQYTNSGTGTNQQFGASSTSGNFHNDNQVSNQQSLYFQQQEVYPTFGTTYSGTFYPDEYPGEKDSRKAGQCQPKKSNRTSKTRHHTPEIMTPYVDLSFLSMPGAISSPLLSEGPDFNAPSNVPPLYYSRPYGPNSPTTNSASGQLTSFNLSAIFPEIGTGKANYNSSGKNSAQPTSSNSSNTTFIPTTFSNS